MNVILQLTPHDPLVARDGRPFGDGQGQRMRGLPWLLPSVVTGSFRTALVKADATLDFSGDMPKRLLQLAVAGVFPVHQAELYLPVPSDAVAEPGTGGLTIKTLHRVTPQTLPGGCDFPEADLKPVLLTPGQAVDDFKPADLPDWWPASQVERWLLGQEVKFDHSFLDGPRQEVRDHVCIDAERGAAAQSQLFATTGLNLTQLPRFGAPETSPRRERFAEVALTVRVTIPDTETQLTPTDNFDLWHPLGGERRLIHWRRQPAEPHGWTCPRALRAALTSTPKVRLVLATPAIFQHGWKPGWLTSGLVGSFNGVRLKLVGVTAGRWKAVSGWSLAPPRGPKPIRRMVPAGSVYFFEVLDGDPTRLADSWLQSVCDEEQEQRDGFGLAVWGTW